MPPQIAHAFCAVMCAADRGPFSLDKHTLLKSPIKGGHVYWQEDITEITAPA